MREQVHIQIDTAKGPMSTDGPGIAADQQRFWQLRRELGLRSVTFRDIARRLDVSPALVSMTAKGQRRNKRVRRALARAAGIRYKNLWEDPCRTS